MIISLLIKIFNNLFTIYIIKLNITINIIIYLTYLILDCIKKSTRNV
jgi:hypothetical protein